MTSEVMNLINLGVSSDRIENHLRKLSEHWNENYYTSLGLIQRIILIIMRQVDQLKLTETKHQNPVFRRARAKLYKIYKTINRIECSILYFRSTLNKDTTETECLLNRARVYLTQLKDFVNHQEKKVGFSCVLAIPGETS